jgi:hypothetical protein
MGASNTDQMPERYQPDPWADATVRAESTGKLFCKIPSIVWRWVDASIGDVLGVAPKSASMVSVGYQTPDILGEVRVNSKSGGATPHTKLRKCVIRYLDVAEGDVLRFNRDSNTVFTIEKV